MVRGAGLWMLALVAGSVVTAEVVPNSLFSENCVLQQGLPVPVWGTAAEGERVSVKFAGQTVTTTAASGAWKVWLKPLRASAVPQTMFVIGERIREIGNVLVGDVWVAGGQSNMERQLGPRPPQPEIIGWQEAAASANFPKIRQFSVPEHLALTPSSDSGGSWAVCSAATAPNFSAVGFFFARAIFRAERVPVGILFSTWGGTAAEAWASAASLGKMADFRGAVERKDGLTGNLDRDKNHPAVLYNAMISPLQAFPIKGVIWYQGESNCDRATQYRELFPLLIADWRRGWELGDFPFLFVQIAPSKFWTPEIREAQLLTLQVARNTAMIGTADIGDPNDMHPAQKAPVGERLALAARALAYGEAIEYSGPLFDSLKVEKGRAVVSFTHTGGGLVAVGGELRGFCVAGSDGKFFPAKAEIKGSSVVVSSEAVKAPAAVRYGWEKAPDINLFNARGLPASPFRTDFEQPLAASK